MVSVSQGKKAILRFVIPAKAGRFQQTKVWSASDFAVMLACCSVERRWIEAFAEMTRFAELVGDSLATRFQIFVTAAC
jgi:hypothetical protein